VKGFFSATAQRRKGRPPAAKGLNFAPLPLCGGSLFLILCFVYVVAAQEAKPLPAPAQWRPLLGEYVLDDETIIILEKDGKLNALYRRTEFAPLHQVSRDLFEFDAGTSRAGGRVRFLRDGRGTVTGFRIGAMTFKRRPLGPEEGATQLKVKPLRAVPLLIKEARLASPPQETGDFLPSDLVELTKLDPTIKLDIRYATTNNLFGTVFYSQPRAFLQRAPAEALVRVNRKLKEAGYGLLVHDGYRPWYVTKVFWDATPEDKKDFVADPAKGSRHNRGAAVDLSLYDLKTGKPVEMVSTYDETTDRAHPDYPGGTSLQRRHRDLLRGAMEAEGFTVYELEWWHFDYQGWERYRIGNELFERIGGR
jgi:D-alanyl-D-alanine dipeptidase